MAIFAVEFRADAASRQVAVVACRGRRGTRPWLLRDRIPHGLGERVIAAGIHGCGEGQHLAPAGRAALADRHHARLADGQGAGLVERDDLDPPGEFERLGVLDQHAVPRGHARPRDDRGRRGETERARAGDHQHADRVDEGVLEGGAGEQPADHRGERDDEHDRHEHGRHLVDQPLDRRLGGLRVLDEANDLRQHRFGADGRRLDFEAAAAVDRSRGHLVAGRLLDRQAFAGEHRFVDAARACADQAVDRDAIAAADHDEVAEADVVDRHFDRLAVAHHQRLVGTQRGKQPDRLGRLPLGARLEPLPEQHERDHDGGRLEVQVLHVPEAVHPDAVDPEVERQAIGGQRAERHQQVHVAGPRSHRPGRGHVEAAPAPELHRRGQQPLHPRRHHPVDADERQVRAEQQRHRERDRQQRVATQPGGRVHGDGLALPGVGDQRGLVARRVDRREQVADAGGAGHEIDGRRFRAEVDVRLQHARHFPQRLLDTRNARGAGHALHGESQVLIRHLVTGGADRSGERGGVQADPFDRRGFGGQVHGDLPHPRHLRERLLDVRDATGAGHALHGQHHAAVRPGRGGAATGGMGVAVHDGWFVSPVDRSARRAPLPDHRGDRSWCIRALNDGPRGIPEVKSQQSSLNSCQVCGISCWPRIAAATMNSSRLTAAAASHGSWRVTARHCAAGCRTPGGSAGPGVPRPCPDAPVPREVRWLVQ